MKKLRFLSSLIVAVLLLSMLGACSEPPAQDASEQENTSQSTDPSPAEDGEKEVIQVATPSWYLENFNKVVAGYEEANPDSPYMFEVSEIVSGSSDRETKAIMMMSSAETAPDAIVMDGFMVNSNALAGYLEPLESYVADWADYEHYVGASLDGARSEGDNQLYAMPLTGAFTGLWYNKVMVEKAGYDPETFQPANWEEMMDAAYAMQGVAESDEFIPFFLFGSTTDSERTSMKPMQGLLSGTDGVLYDYDTKKWVVDVENLTKVLNIYNTVYNVDNLGPAPSLATQADAVAVIQADHMMADNVGLLIDSQNYLNSWGPNGSSPWPEWNEHYGFCYLPTELGEADDPYTTVIGGFTIGIPANSDNKDGGWEFIKTLNSYDNMLSFSLETNNMTPRTDVSVAPEYVDNDYAVYSFFDVTDGMKYGVNRPTTDGYTSVSLLVAEMAEKVVLNSASVEEIIQSYYDQLVMQFGEDKVELIQ